MNPYRVIFFICCIILTSSPSSFGNAPQLGPNGILPGSCSQPEGSYVWYTVSRTPWSVTDLYAVPIGTIDPSDWPTNAAFHTRLLAQLPANPSIQDFADGCSSIWNEFFSSQADVIVMFKRTVLTIKRNVACDSGAWTSSHESTTNSVDDLGWIRIEESPFDLNIPSSSAALKINLDSLSESLNTQPGASTDPFDSVVQVEQ